MSCRARASSQGSEVPTSRWSYVPVDLLLDPAELRVGHHRPVAGLEHPAAPRVDDEQPDVAEVAPVGPLGALVAVGLLVGRRGELAQHRLAVLAGRPHPLVQLVARQVLRREVAEVLVDPVRRQPADDPLLPPGRLLHLPPPQRRGVPVVTHVVVVEDHRGRDRRQQPADVRVAPALVVEPGVLLEVPHLLERLDAGVPPLPDLRADGVRGLVGVHLVAEQQHRVRPPLVGQPGHPLRVGVQRVRVEVLVVGDRVRASRSGRTRRPPGAGWPGRASGSGGAAARESAGGHTTSPSSRTSYGVVEPFGSPSTTTRA